MSGKDGEQETSAASNGIVTDTAVIESFINLQRDRVKRIEGVLSNFEKTTDTRRTKNYFALKINQCQETYKEFFETHKQIVRSNLPTTDEYFTESLALVFEDKYVEAYSVIQDAREEKFPPATPIASTSQPQTTVQRNYTSVQLPSIQMPKFSGRHIDWPSFNDAFIRLVHQNMELDSIQKFNFLKQALPPNQDRDIQEMPLTDATYATAWDLLVKRYNSPRILYMHHLNTLYALPVLQKERAEDIKVLLNASNVCITAFLRLEIPIDKCDHWIAHLIATKLPTKTHHDWEHYWGSHTDIPKFADLEKFLTDRLFTLDAIESRETVHSVALIKSNDAHKSSHANESKAMKRNNRFERKTFHTTTARNNNNGNGVRDETCPICNGTHVIRRCQAFISKDCFERKALADRFKLCINCLSRHHSLSQCSSSKNCLHCGLRHHTLLHFPAIPSNNNSSSSGYSTNHPVQGKQPPNQASIHISSNNNPEVRAMATNVFSAATVHAPKSILLATALIPVENVKTGKTTVLRALIDDCSEGTIISEHAANVLGLRRTPAVTDVSGVGQSSAGTSNEIVQFALRSNLHANYRLFVDIAIVMKVVTANLPSRRVTPQNWPHIQGLVLADPTYFEPGKIDLLIGSEWSASILLSDTRIGQPDHPIARNTHFGWILHGQASTVPEQNSAHNNPSINIRTHHTSIDLTALFHDFIETENIPQEKSLTEEEEWFVDFFKQTHQRQLNGKYMVRLPFKSHNLGRSHQIAVNYFHRLERRFDRVDGLRERYTAGIKEYFDLQQIVPDPLPENAYIAYDDNHNLFVRACTLPHHAIIKEDSLTTKTRIVYNAAAKTSNGRSLNENLCIGPKLQNELPAVILNWRLYEFVFTADIQRMYRCIDMHPEDIPYQHILWKDESGELKSYCLTTVTFGTSPAPALAISVMHQIAEDEREDFPLAEPILKDEMYVDDVQSGGHSIENALAKRDDLIGALRSAGMELRKWCSNHPLLLASIPMEHQSINVALEFNHDETVKTLGMIWQPNIDQFKYKIRFELSKIATKRNVLSTTARLYDPLGYITPVIVVAKVILKRIWGHNASKHDDKRALNWDDVLPDSLNESWEKFLLELPDIEKISIPRWIQFSPDQLRSIELHAFCDGSTSAYAANVYIRTQYTESAVHTHLLIAKSKVTPTNPLTIPRIELCGAVLATRLATWVKSNLRISVTQIPMYFWCDATVVLHWIYGDITRWKTYVANRIGKIHSSTSPQQWNHVGTHDNPADCATRGLMPSQLADFDLWWKGPEWLVKSKEHWPTLQPGAVSVNDEIAEVKSTEIYVHVSIQSELIIFLYSSLYKLVRVNAWIRRFRHNTLNKSNRTQGQLTVAEIQASLFQLVRLVQTEAFGKEIKCILTNEPLPKKCKISGLAPFLDENNILRVRGRLQRSNLPYRRHHPIILPHTHHFTDLVIDDAHFSTLHGGTLVTLTHIRGGYWIANGRQAVRSRIGKCVTCFKAKPEPITQLMGNLPYDRVNPPNRPFLATGVDYTGAIELKASKFRGNTVYKGYIVLFICLATKARCTSKHRPA